MYLTQKDSKIGSILKFYNELYSKDTRRIQTRTGKVVQTNGDGKFILLICWYFKTNSHIN